MIIVGNIIAISYTRTAYYYRFLLVNLHRLSKEYQLQLIFPCVFPSSIPLGLCMNQVIAWRSTQFSAAHYRDVGARWLAEHQGLIFYKDSEFSFFKRS